MKEFLVCLEGSPSSETATRLATDVARACAARLVGLAIIDEPDIRAGTATSIGGASFKHERDESLVADARKNAADWLTLFDRRCREAGIKSRSLEIVGRPARSILAEMENHDLTVIGRDANFRFETERDDAQTRDAILRGASRPVLLVPETAVPQLGSIVLVAYDGSSAAKRALTSFAASGLARSRKVHVATVDDNGVVAREMAEQAVKMLRAEHVTAIPHNIVSVLSNVEALFKLASELKAGLMVMGIFHPLTLARAVLGIGHARPGRAGPNSALHPTLMAFNTPIWTVAPFVLYLVLIAVLPLFFGGFWEHNRNKLLVAALVSRLWSSTSPPPARRRADVRTACDYVSFIALLGALFTISGGICLSGSLVGTPLVNTGFLAVGALLGSLVGTTGASVLLIRPLLRANARRAYATHVVVFFIFIVSNGAGLLTPLGCIRRCFSDICAGFPLLGRCAWPRHGPSSTASWSPSLRSSIPCSWRASSA